MTDCSAVQGTRNARTTARRWTLGVNLSAYTLLLSGLFVLLIPSVGCDEPAAETSEASGKVVPGKSVIRQPDVQGSASGMVAVASRVFPQEESLRIGDSAPPLSIAEWVGVPVNPAEGGRVHAVLFWASWCEPAVQELVRLNQLQEQYGDQLTIVGVTSDDTPQLAAFLQQKVTDGSQTWGEFIRVSLAVDQQNRTARAWQDGIEDLRLPLVFLCDRQGKLQWVGEPAGMDLPLQEMISGTWKEGDALDVFRLERQIMARCRSTGPQTALAEAGRLFELRGHDSAVAMLYLEVLLRAGETAATAKTARLMLAEWQNEAVLLNQLAWLLATATDDPGRDLATALQAAAKAVELTRGQDPDLLDTLARVHFCRGEHELAVETQQRAIALVPERLRGRMQAVLQEYRNPGDNAD